MPSHLQWREEIVAEHDSSKPFAPENGETLLFSVGDRVIFTNEYGAQFRQAIVGLYKPSPVNSLYAAGYRYLVDSDSPWMPVKESSLSLDGTR